ncbi:hypothetical protein ACFPJ1_08150 [Kribbella qitaiheensis]|uniref:hypothetical protein n=1 Tax=Kribbella qitaiheensis TaxID=1544730 RepID=UPI0036086F70
MSSSGSQPPVEPTPAPAAVPQAVRATLLATEHWSLLGTRGTVWSEVMSRISIHLTVASASLVVIALVTQASGFGTAFKVLSIGLSSAVLVLGTLTAVRVHNASVDDTMLVIGMNRLRAAYLEMDPTLADYFVTSWHDDQAGVMRTYTLGTRPAVSHRLGSTTMFVNIVNTMVAGTLGALISNAAGAGPTVVAIVGTISGLAYLAATIEAARRTFARPSIDAHFPSPGA